MSNYNDPHAEITEVGFIPSSEVEVCTMLGSQDINLTLNGNLLFARPQSASFSEKKPLSGDYVEQEFEAVFTSDESEYILRHRQLVEEDSLVLIHYTNGKKLVAGTDMSPVRCEVEHSGSPRTTRITFKRNSPEFAKVLKSLT